VKREFQNMQDLRMSVNSTTFQVFPKVLWSKDRSTVLTPPHAHVHFPPPPPLASASAFYTVTSTVVHDLLRTHDLLHPYELLVGKLNPNYTDPRKRRYVASACVCECIFVI